MTKDQKSKLYKIASNQATNRLILMNLEYKRQLMLISVNSFMKKREKIREAIERINIAYDVACITGVL